MNLIDYTKRPIFFERNRVQRVYDGGKLFSYFFHDPDIDNKYPEEWIASTVKALNKNSTYDSTEGMSIIKNTSITLKELTTQFQKETLGNRTELGILVKLLDSGIRLPLQAHPDPAFSQKYFNSSYGKTEMWLILATRENASICFGFKNQITKEEFKNAINDSETEKDIFSSYLNRVPVKSGEVYLIPAKAVHAIGYGCLILEVQEPTDFTIQPEHWCGDYKLNEHEMYLGLDPFIALDCFDYSICGATALSLAKKDPVILFESRKVKKECLISYEDTPCFGVNRYILSGGVVVLKEAPAIYIVIDGSGSIRGSNYSKNVSRGDYFFLPYNAKDQFEISSDCSLEFVECLPPVV